MADGRWQMADGRWQIVDDRWQMTDNRWQMADGRWQREFFFFCHLISSTLKKSLELEWQSKKKL